VTSSKNSSNTRGRFHQQVGACLLVLILSSQVGNAGEVLDSHVGTHKEHFLLRIDMLIDAEPERVRQLLTDYAHLDRLSHSITQSELLQNNTPHFRVRVTTDGCVIFFCRELVQVQDVTELHDGYILVTVLPEMSDFSYGRNMWRIRTLNNQTRITYSSDLVPDFWVPPLIGTSIFKHRLLEESRQVIDNLERLANLPHDTVKE
jgi:hypothetical protein